MSVGLASMSARDESQNFLEAKQMAADLIGKWPSEQCFDAVELITKHPEISSCRSAILDLAYEQYCRERQAGIETDRVEFAERFANHQRSVLRLLEVHDALSRNSKLADSFAEVSWPASGGTFLDFDLDVELGRGAFSRVFLARERSLGDREVVVKVCLGGLREANVLGKLRHSNIGAVHSVRDDVTSGLSAICMPFLTTTTLMDLIDADFTRLVPLKSARDTHDAMTPRGRQRPVEIPAENLSRTVRMGLQLAEALQYTHEQGIVHGDIKPSNVLVSNGNAVLIDFNLSVRHDANQPQLGGTLVYMAPEQLSALVGSQSQCEGSPSSDVFSLGVTLYESLTGSLPWGEFPMGLARSDAPLLLIHRHAEMPTELRLIRPDIPERVADVIQRCLSDTPSARPSPNELIVEFTAALANTVVEAPPRRVTRSQIATSMLTAVIGGVAIFTLAAVFSLGQSKDTSDPAPNPQGGSGPVSPSRNPATLKAEIESLLLMGKLKAASDLLEVAKRRGPARFTPGYLGYSWARIAEKAIEIGDTQLAFQSAMNALTEFEKGGCGNEFQEPSQHWDNIGYCRRIANRSRQYVIPKDLNLPPNFDLDQAHALLNDMLLNAKLRGSAAPIDFAILNYVVRRWPSDQFLQLDATRCYLHAAIANGDGKKGKNSQGAIEHAWCSISDSGGKLIMLNRLLKTEKRLPNRDEFTYIADRPSVPILLHEPDSTRSSR